MAQQLMSFTRQMMEGVIKAHSTRTDHDSHCCTLATEYAVRLGTETTSSPAPTDDKPSVPASLQSSAPKQRAPRPAEEDKQATDRQLDYILSLGRRVSVSLIAPSHRAKLQAVRDGHGLRAQEASDLIEAMKAQTDERPRPVSNAQLRFIHSLVKAKEWAGTIDFENLTSASASGLIADLKAAPRKPGTDTEADIVHSSVSRSMPEPGYYFADGVYYKVKNPKVESGTFYGYRWSPESETWRYDGQKHFRACTSDTKLTAEQATVFGKKYGRCIVKGCELSHPRSVELGYGPTCAKNQGWPY